MSNNFSKDDDLLVLNSKIQKRIELGEFKTREDVISALNDAGIDWSEAEVTETLTLKRI